MPQISNLNVTSNLATLGVAQSGRFVVASLPSNVAQVRFGALQYKMPVNHLVPSKIPAFHNVATEFFCTSPHSKYQRKTRAVRKPGTSKVALATHSFHIRSSPRACHPTTSNNASARRNRLVNRDLSQYRRDTGVIPEVSRTVSSNATASWNATRT
jgi:hypothetical protein